MLQRIRDLSTERAHKLNRAGDVVVLAVAAGAAALVGSVFHWKVALALFAESAVFWTLAGRLMHQYHAGNGRTFFGDVALTVTMIASVAACMALISLAVPHLPLVYTGRFLAMMVPAVLALRMRLVGARLFGTRPVAEVLVVGIGALGRHTGTELAAGQTPRRLVGYLRFDGETASAPLNAPMLGSVDALEAILREVVVDEVYFASTAGDHDHEVQEAIRTCEKLGVPFALPMCAYRLRRARPAPGSASADGYAHFTTTVRVTPLWQAAKRAFDIVASAVALALLSPVLIVTAILIKVTSPGPVLFRQERVGLLGRRFQMLKFRSMVVDAEARKAALMSKNEQDGPVFKIKHDPRVTTVGRFIRKYSIDELPQIVNVLRGDMSIVGPRPPIPSEVAKYEAWQRRRLSVRPGLTCVWQVNGRNDISFKDWMLLDMRYIDHWSFRLDLDLILKTVPAVLRGRGAS